MGLFPAKLIVSGGQPLLREAFTMGGVMLATSTFIVTELSQPVCVLMAVNVRVLIPLLDHWILTPLLPE
jgi:hypothetical protein